MANIKKYDSRYNENNEKTEVVSTENNKFSSLNASYAYKGLYIE